MWVLLALVLGSGCSSETADLASAEKKKPASEAPITLLEESWPLVYATDEALAPLGAEPGWVALVMERDYKGAAEALGAKGGLPAARAHTEAAFLYRQSALISAYGLIEVYGKTPEPTDPVGVAHLLAVSYAITGDLDRAKAESLKLDAIEGDPTLPWHAPWKAWLRQDHAAAQASWPPDLSSLPGLSLPAPTPGVWPEIEANQLPHYSLPEREGSSASRDMADPGALVALALWHDAAAAKASPVDAANARSMRAGYLMPIELALSAPRGLLPKEMLFGSDLLVSGDIAFLTDLMGEAGTAAIDSHATTSLIAWLAKRSRGDGVKVSAELAVDEVTSLRNTLEAMAAAKAGGEEKGQHRRFAHIAYVGALRSLALVAEREGDREASGILRINALEHSEKERACPIGLLALAAWDASNRYPMRAQDILHNEARRYPSIEIARYGLDVLALRVGSERVETPGM